MVTVSRIVAHLLTSRWREKYRPRCFGLPGPGGYTKSPNGGYHGVVLLHCLCRHFSLSRRTTYLSSSVVARDPYLGEKIRALVAVENQLGAIVRNRAMGSIRRHQDTRSHGFVDSQDVLSHRRNNVASSRQRMPCHDKWKRDYRHYVSLGLSDASGSRQQQRGVKSISKQFHSISPLHPGFAGRCGWSSAERHGFVASGEEGTPGSGNES